MKRAFVVAGMTYGDEGKGTMTDWLCRRYGAQVVVRYNGGCQAAHNVITDNNEHHTFSMFGSGTLAGVPTFLSPNVLVDLRCLAWEAEKLSKIVTDPWGMMALHPQCTLITYYHVLMNRMRELARGTARHGSVGRGVGEARQGRINGWFLTPEILQDRQSSIEILRTIQAQALAEFHVSPSPENNTAWYLLYSNVGHCKPEMVYDEYVEILNRLRVETVFGALGGFDTLVFEGAQGVLLDEVFGTPPYNTWTNTTFGNALEVCAGLEIEKVERIGVFRTYFTRHGPGPFPTEGGVEHCELHNEYHPWMGAFRQGSFDYRAAGYALGCAPADCLAITHMDRVRGNGALFIDTLETKLKCPVKYLSYGPRPCDKRVVPGRETNIVVGADSSVR